MCAYVSSTVCNDLQAGLCDDAQNISSVTSEGWVSSQTYTAVVLLYY